MDDINRFTWSVHGTSDRVQDAINALSVTHGHLCEKYEFAVNGLESTVAIYDVESKMRLQAGYNSKDRVPDDEWSKIVNRYVDLLDEYAIAKAELADAYLSTSPKVHPLKHTTLEHYENSLC